MGNLPRVFSIRSNTLNRHILKIRRQYLADLPQFALHTLRHTVITHLPRLGTNREVIQALVGHSHSDPTSTYLHYDYLKEMRAAVARLGEFIYSLRAARVVEEATS